MLGPHVLAVAAVLLTGVAGQYKEEELIRDPYQYQVKVEDPETANKYEVPKAELEKRSEKNLPP